MEGIRPTVPPPQVKLPYDLGLIGKALDQQKKLSSQIKEQLMASPVISHLGQNIDFKV